MTHTALPTPRSCKSRLAVDNPHCRDDACMYRVGWGAGGPQHDGKNFFKLNQSICETVPSALLGLPVGRPLKENSPALHHLTTPMFGDPRESTRVRGVVSRGLPPGSSGEEKIACMHVPSLHGRSDPNSKLSSCGTASAEARRDRCSRSPGAAPCRWRLCSRRAVYPLTVRLPAASP